MNATQVIIEIVSSGASWAALRQRTDLLPRDSVELLAWRTAMQAATLTVGLTLGNDWTEDIRRELCRAALLEGVKRNEE